MLKFVILNSLVFSVVLIGIWRLLKIVKQQIQREGMRNQSGIFAKQEPIEPQLETKSLLSKQNLLNGDAALLDSRYTAAYYKQSLPSMVRKGVSHEAEVRFRDEHMIRLRLNNSSRDQHV